MEGLSEYKDTGRHCILEYDDWIDFGEALDQSIQKIIRNNRFSIL